MAWINNYTRIKLWDVTTHPCPNANDGWHKPPLNQELIEIHSEFKTFHSRKHFENTASIEYTELLDILMGVLAATKQLYEWFRPSVRPDVRPSVRQSVTPFSQCSCHRIIRKLSEVITNLDISGP